MFLSSVRPRSQPGRGLPSPLVPEPPCPQGTGELRDLGTQPPQLPGRPCPMGWGTVATSLPGRRVASNASAVCPSPGRAAGFRNPG